ncbi:hypothetical protein F2Q69_00033106 [Brassica cretica]|uniref:ORC1/DEAH AAA+ ATPase domain-containing protein n=1 Tax=Brassica cretica TaxID=69181 RepID=A0A8S9SQ97_BRACR|nr:hypothetical protein F2Q69_00033106 [Brassica cretica]
MFVRPRENIDKQPPLSSLDAASGLVLSSSLTPLLPWIRSSSPSPLQSGLPPPLLLLSPSLLTPPLSSPPPLTLHSSSPLSSPPTLSVKSKESDLLRRAKTVLEFVKACTEQKKAGSLYICGCPGTGKSLSMEKVRQQAQDWAKQEGLPCLETVYVNCTSLTKTIDIFSKILGENETGKKAVASSSPLQQLQIMFSQKQQSPSLKMM